MITVKDRLILKHIERFKFISIDQARLIAYPFIKTGYQSAQNRLRRLVDKEERLKIFYNKALNQNLYIDINTDTSKMSDSSHTIYLMDFYAKLVASESKIEKFETYKKWADGKYISNAIAIYTFGGYKFRNIIEVNASNNSIDLSMFDEVKDEILKEFDNKLPRIILIDSRRHMNYNVENFSVTKLNFNLNNFAKIFI